MMIAAFVKDSAVLTAYQCANPGRTVERAKHHLHSAQPDLDTARALKILDNAWIAVQKAKVAK